MTSSVNYIKYNHETKNTIVKNGYLVGIQFGLLSPEMIKGRSSLRETIYPDNDMMMIDSNNKSSNAKIKILPINTHSCYVNNQPKEGGIFDPRLGAVTNNEVGNEVICYTCGEQLKQCAGHFAHIEFEKPVYNPIFRKNIKEWISKFCYFCHYRLATASTSPVNIQCKTCNYYQPKYGWTDKGLNLEVSFIYSVGSQPPSQQKSDNSKKRKRRRRTAKPKPKTTIKYALMSDKVYELLKKISNKEMIEMGYNPEYSRPEWMMYTNFPVPPPCIRPPIVTDNSRAENDMTKKII